MVQINEEQSQFDHVTHKIRKKHRTGSSSSTSTGFTEVKTYLGERTSDIDITTYWRTNLACFPMLYLMAQDFLAVAASGVGVEQLFNSAQDICSYHQGCLHAETIEKLMLQLTTDCFLVKCEYEQMREDDVTPDTVNKRDEHEAEDYDELVYISNKLDPESEGRKRKRKRIFRWIVGTMRYPGLVVLAVFAMHQEGIGQC